MSLTSGQRAYIRQSFDGLRAAMHLQLELADFSHERIATEYLITTKIVEELLRHQPGRVEVERKTRQLFNLISVPSPRGRPAHAGIRSGRIDAVVFSHTNKLIPDFFAEMKIRVTSLGSVRKDLERFAKLLRALDPSTTSHTMGASVFPFTAEGRTRQEIQSKVINYVLRLRKQIEVFAAAQPGVIVRLHIDKGALVLPQPDEIDLPDGTMVQLGLLPGRRTIGLAITVARN